jgi:hypothetical protein
VQLISIDLHSSSTDNFDPGQLKGNWLEAGVVQVITNPRRTLSYLSCSDARQLKGNWLEAGVVVVITNPRRTLFYSSCSDARQLKDNQAKPSYVYGSSELIDTSPTVSMLTSSGVSSLSPFSRCGGSVSKASLTVVLSACAVFRGAGRASPLTGSVIR